MMSIKCKWVPKVRSKFVANDGREFELPAAWEWVSQLPIDEKMQFVNTGCINRRQCRDLWQWLGRTDRVPKHLLAYVHWKDLEATLPGASAHGQ